MKNVCQVFLFASAIVTGVATCLVPIPANAVVVHVNKTVVRIHSGDTRQCFFFQLTGVSEADPVVPGDYWFAIPQSNAGYKDAVAILMLARATGMPLAHVKTTGGLACGLAEVSNLSL